MWQFLDFFQTASDYCNRHVHRSHPIVRTNCGKGSMPIINFRRPFAVNALMEGRVARRTALTYLVAGSLAAILPRRASAMDLSRFTAPIAITADDIAWFRECRSAWS